MQNLPATPATLTNRGVVSANVGNLTLSSGLLLNANTTTSGVDQNLLPNARLEGLWVRFVSPWQLDLPWEFVSVPKSNVDVVNV